MLKKLSRLYDLLSKRESGMLMYQIVITFPDKETVPRILIKALYKEKDKLYKYGNMTDNFDFNRYLDECLEDLAKESK